MSKSKALLIVACVLSLMMVTDRLVDFIASRIPPFKVGECLGIEQNPLVNVKILDNHVLAGYSDVEVDFLIASEKAKVSFEELRLTPTKKVKCQ